MDSSSILIIDDDRDQRKILDDILRCKGYETANAGNGEDGFALFKERPVNLALIDLILPDIPGMKVLERIKEHQPTTEVIILTGNASLETAIEATNRGAFSYLLKPYDIDQLLLNIKRAIEKQRAGEEIIRRSLELQRSNNELKVLHEVSQVLGRTIELETLFKEVLIVLSEIETFRFERKGTAFIAEEDRLRIVASIGLNEAELKPCNNLRLGECICGLAASTGEIMISGTPRPVDSHVIGRNGAAPHGHVILPLKTVDAVVGVLCFHTRHETKINERELALLSSLGNQIGIAVNNAKLYEAARSGSLQDPLTGLGNRRSLQVQLEKSVEAANRYGESLSVIMLDIDHFKHYNDTYGHLEGDRLLIKLSEILTNEMRKADYIFRYGGEEFLVILIETDENKACEAAERMRWAVEAEAGVTISLGIAAYREGISTGEELIGNADAALYRAKQQGRNRVELSG